MHWAWDILPRNAMVILKYAHKCFHNCSHQGAPLKCRPVNDSLFLKRTCGSDAMSLPSLGHKEELPLGFLPLFNGAPGGRQPPCCQAPQAACAVPRETHGTTHKWVWCLKDREQPVKTSEQGKAVFRALTGPQPREEGGTGFLWSQMEKEERKDTETGIWMQRGGGSESSKQRSRYSCRVKSGIKS